MESAHILIAHRDEATVAEWLADLSSEGHRVLVTRQGEEALGQIRRECPDLVVVGSDLWPEGGLTLLDQAKRERPSTLVVVTGPPSVDGVLAAFRAGAFDYLEEPVPPGRLAETASRALGRLELGERRRRLAEELRQERARVMELERQLAPEDPFRNIAGASPILRALLETLREIARTDSTVLLTGESGTGKGVLARAIHDASSRRGGPFVEANCVVYSEGVLHSELFGHERGAFTGAARLKKGRFELASGGTLFLDEIGEITPATQLLLLRVLQGRAFERVGGEETVEIDVRLVAATNRDLTRMVESGHFREDLFYRLNVVTIDMPPLRERKEDVAALASFFIRRFSGELKKKVDGLEPDALKLLTRYHWPGNIRELENAIERAMLLADGAHIAVDDLRLGDPGALGSPRDSSSILKIPPTGIPLEDIERLALVEALKMSNWVQKDAAELLGISPRVMNYKIKVLGIEFPRGRRAAALREAERDAETVGAV